MQEICKDFLGWTLAEWQSFYHEGTLEPRDALAALDIRPACRTLDCVSIFALTVEDAAFIVDIAAGFDEKDAYSRKVHLRTLWFDRRPRYHFVWWLASLFSQSASHNITRSISTSEPCS